MSKTPKFGPKTQGILGFNTFKTNFGVEILKDRKLLISALLQ
jgi:hypothetical protein